MDRDPSEILFKGREDVILSGASHSLCSRGCVSAGVTQKLHTRCAWGLSKMTFHIIDISIENVICEKAYQINIFDRPLVSSKRGGSARNEFRHQIQRIQFTMKPKFER